MLRYRHVVAVAGFLFLCPWLAQQAAAVVTVEVDLAMFQLAAEELHRLPNVVMLHADVLKNKNRLNPAVIEETLRTGGANFERGAHNVKIHVHRLAAGLFELEKNMVIGTGGEYPCFF